MRPAAIWIVLPLAAAWVACARAGSGSAARREAARSAEGAVATRALPVVSPGGGADSAEAGEIARLERAARALAHTAGCSSARECRTAPVGVKACGGPRSYLVYCAASTDTVALAKALEELERAERAYTARAGLMSTCEFQLAPATTFAGGSCRAAGTPP